MISIFVATPMFGGQCYGGYTDSVIKLAVECSKRGIRFHFFPIFNESHIDRARNVCADEFIKSGFTHLFFIDGDIQFNAAQALEMVSLGENLVCGFYPKKAINWKRVIEAVKLGYDDPEAIERFGTYLVYTPSLDDSGQYRSIYDLSEIHEGGTGFMCIKRGVFDAILEKNPGLVYHKYGPGSEKITCYFDAHIDREPYPHFITEDYGFCELARRAGYKVMLAPWIKLTHHGYYRWIGDIEAMSKILMKEAA